MRTSSILAGLALALALCGAPGASAQTMAESFAAPPADARPLVRWWWFGPAVEHEHLAREIAAMRAGGFGGFEIQPVYPLLLDDPATGFRNREYMSEEFLEAVRFVAETGRAQDMRVDVTIGTGWPFGGPHIPVTQASAQIRMLPIALPAGARDAPLPAIGTGERLLAVFLADGATTAPDAAHARPLRFDANTPRVAVAPANRERTLLAFMMTRTGQQVKRPAFGGEGYVLDHMSAAAVRTHLDAIGEPLMRTLGAHPPYAVFSDSLEAYGSDWTDDFLDEFQRRRGYDLAPHLPALFFDIGPNTGAIRHDWGHTITELVDERYLTPINTWARERNTLFRSQTYGVPGVTLSSNRLVSLAEGEGAYWRRFTSTRWATSANHLYGRTVSSAESWTWLHSPSFRATPLDIKAEADTLMLQGVNEFIAHGWPYSPPEAGEPGFAFYAAAVFNDHNPWWGVMPDVNIYLQRMAHLLRQGEPVADVAILIPTEDAFAGMTPGQASVNIPMRGIITDALTAQILDAGYSFDYVDAPAMEAEGFKHKVLILPSVTRIEPALYRRIAAFVERGGFVLAVDRLPDLGAGLINADAETREVRAISAALFADGARNARQTAAREVGVALRSLTPPDLTGAPPELGFVHRKLANGDLYFVANTGNQPIRARLGFRAQSSSAQWWEPRTGEAHTWTPGSEVALAPYESRVFVFGAAASAPVAPLDPVSTPNPIDLSRGWSVRFDGANASRTVSAPHAWTDDPATRFFSGEAIYTRTITVSAAQIAAGQTLLNFGDGAPIALPEGQRGTMALLDSPVREAVEVFVNGRRAGSVWAPPYTLDLGPHLRPGSNRLELRVSNTAINAMAGRTLTDYRLLTLRYGERFQMQDMANLQPIPSGILNAVTLTNAR